MTGADFEDTHDTGNTLPAEERPDQVGQATFIGQVASVAALATEQPAPQLSRLSAEFDELLAAMQEPGVMDHVHSVFSGRKANSGDAGVTPSEAD